MLFKGQEQVHRSPATDGGGGGGRQVEARGLSKVFVSTSGERTVALQNLDLTIESGSICCIIGPSGCGKTTFLNLVAGFEEPSTGAVLVDGNEVRDAGVDRVVIFQDVIGSLMPWMTAAQNVAFGLKLAGVSKAERRERAIAALEMVGLGKAVDKYISELSGGMQQRVQIARAMVLRPAALLMDEPFGALDYLTRSKLQTQLQDVHAKTGITVLFVTHDISEAAILGDQICVMGPGGTLVKKLEVDIERPRSVTDPKVNEIVAELTDLILAPDGEETTGEEQIHV